MYENKIVISKNLLLKAIIERLQKKETLLRQSFDYNKYNNIDFNSTNKALSFNLYLKYKHFVTKKEKKPKNNNKFEQDSIFNCFDYLGLKGKRTMLKKKNFETPLIRNICESNDLVKNTICSLDNLNQSFLSLISNLSLNSL